MEKNIIQKNDVTNSNSNNNIIDNAAQLQLTEHTCAVSKSTNLKVNVTEFRNDNDLLSIPIVLRLKKNSVRQTEILKAHKNTPIHIDEESTSKNFG